MIQIKNRSTNECVYSIPELNIRREFRPGEIREVEKQELVQLLYQAGAHQLLEDNFIINDAELAKQYFSVAEEPEYWMQEEDIIELIKTGSQDKLLDFLDFAPQGAIGLLKQYAVTLPMTDMNKINILKENLGFDVNKILSLIASLDQNTENAPIKQRRVRK